VGNQDGVITGKRIPKNKEDEVGAHEQSEQGAEDYKVKPNPRAQEQSLDKPIRETIRDETKERSLADVVADEQGTYYFSQTEARIIAKQVLSPREYELFLLKLHMPDLNKAQAARILRRDWQTIDRWEKNIAAKMADAYRNE
jgi:hypothetical protein